MFLTRHKLVVALFVAIWCVASAGPVVAVDAEKPFIWPTTGRITQPYGCTGFWAEPRRGSCAHFHGGVDIANARGTLVRAAAEGVISHVGWDPWMRRNPSWMVIIRHGGGIETMYAHLRDKPMDGVKRGERVRQGQIIGLMDRTGMATGPHLHFSVISDGHWVNPRNFVAGRPTRRKPVGTTTVREATCDNFGAGFGAYNGGVTAMPLEFDGPRTCSA